MKLTKLYVPTLIALMAACAAPQPLQAQSPARQSFPWSSSSATEPASRAASSVKSLIDVSTQSISKAAIQSVGKPISQLIDQADTMADNVLTEGETIYLDEQGREITREQLLATLTVGQNEVTSALPSANRAVATFGQDLGQNFEQRVTPLRSVDTSMWGKTKSMTSKVASVWKKPSMFGTPEGMTLPSMKTGWAKPKFDEPTTWFSRKTENPITFASIDSLPRKGQLPTSIDGPMTQMQYAKQSAESFTPSFNSESDRFRSAESVYQAADDRVASEFSAGSDFNLRR